MITTTTTTTTTRNSSNSNNNNNSATTTTIHKQQHQQQQQRRGTTTTQRLTTTKKLTTSPLFSASSTTIQNNNQNNNRFVSALGPLSLLGGTAAVYTSSVLHHPSSTLTPLSVLYMVLLALQYSIQPGLSQKHIRSETSKQSVAFVEETTKTAIAAAVVVVAAASTTTTTTTKPASNWSLSSSLTVAGLPAILYAVQGVLQYQSQQHLDAVTYNGLTQTKTLFAAVCCFALLGKKQSLVQTLSLLVLLLSSLVFQGIVVPTMRAVPSSNNKHTASASAITNNNNNNNHSNNNKKNPIDFFWKGVVPCLTATFLSGLAGALSQKGLQVYNRDAYVYTIEISVFSALTLLASMFCTSVFHNNASATSNKPTATTKQQRFSFFRGWTKETWIPIVCKAFGGVLTALVHKHAGSVSKGFALMFGLVLSGCFASFATTGGEEKEGSSLKPHQWWGTVLVLVSGWMHFTHPPK